jgi:hypothetical protein
MESMQHMQPVQRIHLTTVTTPILKPAQVSMVSNDEAGYAEVFLIVVCAIMVGCTFACHSNIDFLVIEDPPDPPLSFSRLADFSVIGMMKRIAAGFIG